MFRSAASLSVAALVLTTAPAQVYQGEGPGIVRPALANPGLGAQLAPNVTQVGQLLLTPVAGSSSLYYLTATVEFANAATGWDAISGHWNEQTQAFVRNADVDHLNSPGDEFACSVAPDLLTLVMDTPPTHPIGQGRPIFATRTSAGVPFGPAQPVTYLPQMSVDPQLCNVEGRLHLLYVVGDALWIGQFAGGLLATPRVVVRRNGLHSPSPIADADGDAKAVIYAVREGSSHSSAWFTADIETGTGAGAFEILDRGTWLANPDANAGLLRYAEAASGSYRAPQELGVLAIGGTKVSMQGGTDNLRITVFMPPQFEPGSLPFEGVVFIGQLGSTGIPIPGFGGSPFSLQPSGLITLPPGLFDKASGMLRYSLPTPPLPHFELQMVPLAIDRNASPPALFVGNNAPLVGEDTNCLCVTENCGRPSAFGTCPDGCEPVVDWVEKQLADGSWVWVENKPTMCIKAWGDLCGGGKTCKLAWKYTDPSVDENGDTVRTAVHYYECR